MRTFASFTEAKARFEEEFRHRSYEVRAPRWQGIDVSTKPEMAMRELFSQSFQIPLREIERLGHWQADIRPNLPFADVHFAERVGGEPTNPGEAYKIWPWGNAAEKFRDHRGKFSHTYQERFWPKHADREPARMYTNEFGYRNPRYGIRYEYGDLNDLVNHLASDPLSRQAYMPIWFPEDGTCRGRKPCTLGYHLLMRHDYLHITYHIRSCDFIRHWADDCYLAVRLLLWVLDRLREKDPLWEDVKPGMYVMHIASFHLFVNDFHALQAKAD